MVAALALGAAWLLEWFVDLPWCVSWVVAPTSPLGSGFGQGLERGEEAAQHIGCSGVPLS